MTNSKLQRPRIDYFVFGLLVLHGRDLMNTPLTKRRELMNSVLKLLCQGIRALWSNFDDSCRKYAFRSSLEIRRAARRQETESSA